MHSTGVSVLAEKWRLSAAWSRGTSSIARALHVDVDAIMHHDHGGDWKGIVAGISALSFLRDVPPPRVHHQSHAIVNDVVKKDRPRPIPIPP